MEPLIRFAKTDDGVAIAYWSTGEGVPIVHMPWLPWSHIQLEWRNGDMQQWFAALLKEGRLIRYDTRGTGLSDRVPSDLGIAEQTADLRAVIKALGLTSIVLLATFHSAPAALAFAANNPELVAGLIIWAGYARGEEYSQSPLVGTLRGLVNDWDLYTETAAHAFVGWDVGDASHDLAFVMREAVERDVALKFLDRLREFDSIDCLAEIKCPTLVLHPRSFALVDIGLARQMVTGIPGARLVVVEGESLAPTRGNFSAVLDGIRGFMADQRPVLAVEARAPEAAAATGDELPLPGLTARELEVLRLVASGLNGKEIADRLVLSRRTVERHIANIYAKVNVNNRSQITAFAITHGLI